VVCIRHMDESYGMKPGEEAFENVDMLDIHPEDIHVNKTYGNAFNKTELAEKLTGMGVDTVILAGYCAEECVLATCVGARDSDLMPIIIRGTLISHSLERIRFVEDVNEVITIGAFWKAVS
jgi:nicotinamidase-related amidase